MPPEHRWTHRKRFKTGGQSSGGSTGLTTAHLPQAASAVERQPEGAPSLQLKPPDTPSCVYICVVCSLISVLRCLYSREVVCGALGEMGLVLLGLVLLGLVHPSPR